MKDAKDYLTEAAERRERLPDLIERVKREAYAEGYSQAGNQMFAIAHDTSQRVDAFTTRMLDTRQHG